MNALPISPRPLFATSIALFVALAIMLFVGASSGSAAPEAPSEPAVSPYAHVESSLHQAVRNEGAPVRDATTRNAVDR